MTRQYLVTGGAGFVGSHLVAALVRQGAECTVLDNLSMGHRQAVPDGVRLVVGEVDDTALLDDTLAGRHWDGAFHFAALSLVGDSMRRPYEYLRRNVDAGLSLIEACVKHKVGGLVVSSTAALFAVAGDGLIDETTPIDPGSPYGESKWMLERALLWAGRIHGLRSSALRYFNAAGADPEGALGEDHRPETHLIPLVIDAALGRRDALTVFGDDYATPDGTCIRDYVHVCDLASAHIGVLEHLTTDCRAYNLGTGTGNSVMDVVRSVERVSGHVVPLRIEARRPGDPAILVASSKRIAREVNWRPRFVTLDDIVATAFAWRERHPNGYAA